MAAVAQTVARLWADDLGYIVTIRSKRSSNPRPEPVRQPYSVFYLMAEWDYIRNMGRIILPLSFSIQTDIGLKRFSMNRPPIEKLRANNAYAYSSRMAIQ